MYMVVGLCQDYNYTTITHQIYHVSDLTKLNVSSLPERYTFVFSIFSELIVFQC